MNIYLFNACRLFKRLMQAVATSDYYLKNGCASNIAFLLLLIFLFIST